MPGTPSVTCSAMGISLSRDPCERSSHRLGRPESTASAPQGALTCSWGGRHEGYTANIVAASIELSLNTDVRALSQEIHASGIQRTDIEFANALVRIVRQGKHTRAQVYRDDSPLKSKRAPAFGENLNIRRRLSFGRELHSHHHPRSQCLR